MMNINVSNHAIVRWIERVERYDTTAARVAACVDDDHAILGILSRIFDIEAIRKKILTPLVVEAARAGVKRVRSNGHILLIERRQVVTVVPINSQRNIAMAAKRRHVKPWREVMA